MLMISINILSGGWVGKLLQNRNKTNHLVAKCISADMELHCPGNVQHVLFAEPESSLSSQSHVKGRGRM